MSTTSMHPISSEEKAFWTDIRKQFYLHDHVTYLQGGTVGPSAKPTIEKVIELVRKFETDPLQMEDGGLLGPLVEESREKLAAFVGTTADRIALVLNTTMGMNIPGQGLIWERGTEILLSDQEYPAVKALWKWVAERDGLTLNYIPLPVPPTSPQDIVDAYAAGINEKTSILVFSHVYFTTGLVAPIKALTKLAHDNNAVAIIDGAHAVGNAELNLSDVGCDFYTSSCHKWLLSPKGVGFLYMDAKYQNKVRPVIIGHNMGETDTAARYDVNGTRDMTHHAALGTAIDFQLEIGWADKIRPYCLGMASYLKTQALERIRGSRLTIPMDTDSSAFIVTFSIEGIDLGKVCHHLWEDYKIEVTANGANELQFFRVSIHFYDSYEDIDRFINGIIEVIAKYDDVHKKED
jgi:isopenicillin-N epimerase